MGWRAYVPGPTDRQPMLRRSSPDDPGLTSLHRLEFYKRKKDWKLEKDKSSSPDNSSDISRTIKHLLKLQKRKYCCSRISPLSKSNMATVSQTDKDTDKDRSKGARERQDIMYCSDVNRTYSVHMRSESMAGDSFPVSCDLQDASLTRSCYFTSLVDTDILSGSFLAHRSLEDLTDERTFQAEVWERPHSSQLDVSHKRTYASVAAKMKDDIQSLDQTTSNQYVDQSQSAADDMAVGSTISDLNLWPTPGKNRWNKHNKNDPKEKPEDKDEHIRYSKDTLHGLNQNDKSYASRILVNRSRDPNLKAKTSTKSEDGSHSDGKNLTQTNDTGHDDCDAPENDVEMAGNNDVPKNVSHKGKQECENEVEMPKNYYPMSSDHNYSMQTKDDPRCDGGAMPKNDYPMYNNHNYMMQTNNDPKCDGVAMPNNYYPIYGNHYLVQAKDDRWYDDNPNMSVPKYDDSDFIGCDFNKNMSHTNCCDAITSTPPGFDRNDRQNMQIDRTCAYDKNTFRHNNYDFGNNYEHPLASDINQSCYYNDKFIYDNNKTSSFNIAPHFDQTSTAVNNQMPTKDDFGSYHNGGISVPPGFNAIDQFGRDVHHVYQKRSFADVEQIENPNLYSYAYPNENLNRIPFQTRALNPYPQSGLCNTLNDQNCVRFECSDPTQPDSASYIDGYRTTLVQPAPKNRLLNEGINSSEVQNLPYMYQAFPNQQLWPVERYDNGNGFGRGRARKYWIDNPGFARYKGYPC